MQLTREKKLVRYGCSLTRLLIGLIVTLPVAVVIFVIWPFKKVRIGYLYADRIGHFVFDYFWYLANQKGSEQFVDLFFLKGKLCNQSLAGIVARSVRLSPFFKYLHSWLRLFPFTRKHCLLPARDINGSRDINNSIGGALVSENVFSQTDHDLGNRYLTNVGIGPDDPFVCLVVRDERYLQEVTSKQKGYWGYHDYRNSRIEDYRKGALQLAELGYTVFRMGKHVKGKFSVLHPNIIDYANSSYRNDFLDLWLMAHCKFCISTCTGLDHVALCFGRPIAFINFLPLGDACSWHPTVNVPKKLFWLTDGRLLSFSEYVRFSLNNLEDYARHGIGIEDLSEDEIVSCMLEAEQRFRGSWDESREEVTLQKSLWDLVKAESTQVKRHSLINQQAYFGQVFLKNLGAGKAV